MTLPIAIRSVSVGEPIVVPDNYGDTWALAWADDDNLYASADDTLGFGIPAELSLAIAELAYPALAWRASA